MQSNRRAVYASFRIRSAKMKELRRAPTRKACGIAAISSHSCAKPSMAVVPARNPWNSTSVVLSPCIGVCDVDPAGVCRGCERTLAEIADWATMEDRERVRLMLHVLPVRTAERAR